MGVERYGALDNGRKEAPMSEALQLRARCITNQRRDFVTALICLKRHGAVDDGRKEEKYGADLRCLVYVQVRVEPTAVRMSISCSS